MVPGVGWAALHGPGAPYQHVHQTPGGEREEVCACLFSPSIFVGAFLLSDIQERLNSLQMTSVAAGSQQIALLFNESNSHARLDFASPTVGAKINLPLCWDEFFLSSSCPSSDRSA